MRARPAFPPRSLQRRSPEAISTLHNPSMLVRHFHLSGRAPPNLFPRCTVHPRSTGALVSLRLAQLPPSFFHASHSIHAGPALPPISTLHSPSTLVRRSRLAPSSGAPPKLFPRFTSSTLVQRSRLAPSSGAPRNLFLRFTVHPRSSGAPVSLPPAALPLSYFHASHSTSGAPRFTVHPGSSGAPASLPPPKLFPCFTLHPRPALHASLPSRSLQRSSPQAIPTLHSPSRSSGASVSLPPAELPPSYFQASQSIHARPALPSRSLQRRSPQAISTLSTPSALVPSFRPSFLPSFPSFLSSFLSSFLPSFPLSFLPSFLPSLLVRLFCLAPLAAKETKREPKNRRWFWGKTEKSVTPILHCRPTASTDSLSCVPTPRKPSMRQVLISDKGQFLE